MFASGGKFGGGSKMLTMYARRLSETNRPSESPGTSCLGSTANSQAGVRVGVTQVPFRARCAYTACWSRDVQLLNTMRRRGSAAANDSDSAGEHTFTKPRRCSRLRWPESDASTTVTFRDRCPARARSFRRASRAAAKKVSRGSALCTFTKSTPSTVSESTARRASSGVCTSMCAIGDERPSR